MARGPAASRWTPVLSGLLAACASATGPDAAGPFSLVAYVPGDGAEEVDRDAPIRLLFTQAPDAASFGGAGRPVVRLGATPASPELPGDWIAGTGDERHVLRFTAAPGLVGYGAVIGVTVPAGLAREGDGRTLGRDVSFSFTTERLPPLRLVASSPPSGGLVERAPVLTLTFSEPPDCAAFGVGAGAIVPFTETRDPHPNWIEDGEPRPVQGRWGCVPPPAGEAFTREGGCRPPGSTGGADYCTVRFIPLDEEFPGAFDALRVAPSSTVTLTLPGPGEAAPLRSRRAANLGSTTDGTFVRTEALVFRTADPPPLQLARVGPPLGQSTLNGAGDIAFTFSAPPSCASLAGIGFEEVYDPWAAAALGGPGRLLAGRWSCEGRLQDRESVTCERGRCEAVFTPTWPDPLAASLRAGSTVRVTFPAAGDDARVEAQAATSRGGALAEHEDVTLAVPPPPPLLVLASSPANASEGLPPYPTFRWTLSEPPDCDAFARALSIEARIDPAFGGELLEPLARWTCPRTPLAPGGPAVACGGDPNPCTVRLDVLEAQPPSTTITVRVRSRAPASGAPAARSARATSNGGALVDDWVVRARTSPPPPLRAWLANPVPEATEVDVETAIDVDLSDPPRCETVADGLSVVELDGADTREVDGVWFCPANAFGFSVTCAQVPSLCRLRFRPAQPFARNARVGVHAAAGSRGALRAFGATSEGGFLAEDFGAWFSTTTTRPPRVVTTTPAPGTRLSDRELTVSVGFDTDGARLDCATVVACDTEAALGAGTCSVLATADTATGERLFVPVHTGCTDDPATLTVTPDLGAVPWGAQLRVRVAAGPTGVRSRLLDTQFPLPAEWSTTYALPLATPLRPTAADPWPGAEDVDPLRPVVVRFDAPVDCSSIGADSVQLQEHPAPPFGLATQPAARSLPYAVTCDGPTVTLQPSTRASAGARVSVSLVPGAAGGPVRTSGPEASRRSVEEEISWDFQVRGPSAPELLRTMPPAGAVVASGDVLRLVFSRAMRCAALRQRLSMEVPSAGLDVPIDVTCGDDTARSSTTDGPVAFIEVLALPLSGRPLVLTVPSGLPATDAIEPEGAPAAGLLATTLALEFEGAAAGRLRLESAHPSEGATAPPVQPVVLRFDRAIAAGTLVPCGTGGLPAACNVWVAPSATPQKAWTRALAIREWSADGRAATLVPVDAPQGRWEVGSSLVLVVEGGATGPAGTDASTMPANFARPFLVGDPGSVIHVAPAQDAAAVALDVRPCVTLADRIADASGPVSFLWSATGEDGLAYVAGEVAAATLEGAVGLERNVACLDLPARRWPGHAGSSPLPPSSTVTIELPGGRTLAGGSVTSTTRWTFTTAAPLQRPSVAWALGTRTGDPAARPVPVAGALDLSFLEDLDGRIPAFEGLRVETADGQPVPFTASFTSGSASTVRIGPAPRWPAGNGPIRYELVLAAGDVGVRSASGTTLDHEVRVPFDVEAPTVLQPAAPGGLVASGGWIQLLSPVRPLGLTAAARLLVQGDGQDWPAAVVPSAHAIAVLPLRPMPPGTVVSFDVSRVEDQQGNAVRVSPGTVVVAPDLPGPPATMDCATASTCPGFAPPPDGAGTFVLPDGAPALELVRRPGVVGDVPLLIPAIGGTVGAPVRWFLDDPSPACAAAPSEVSPTMQPSFEATGDLRLRFEAAPGTVRGGCRYAFIVEQGRWPNVFGLVPSTRGCSAPGGPPATDPLLVTACEPPPRIPGLELRADARPPVLAIEGVFDREGRAWTTPGVLPGRGQVVVVSDEPLLPGSVTPMTTGGAATTLSADGRRVTFRLGGLSGGSATVLLDGVTDLSRNRAATFSRPFTIDAVPPVLERVVPTQDARAPHGALRLEFSEPVGHFPKASMPGGAIEVAVDGTPAAGAVRTTPGSAKELVWMPLAPITPGSVVSVRAGDPTAGLLSDDAQNGAAEAVRTALWP